MIPCYGRRTALGDCVSSRGGGPNPINNANAAGVASSFWWRWRAAWALGANPRVIDSNGDGKIIMANAVWADLKVWQDKTRDGVIQDGSLSSSKLGATISEGARLSY